MKTRISADDYLAAAHRYASRPSVAALDGLKRMVEGAMTTNARHALLGREKIGDASMARAVLTAVEYSDYEALRAFHKAGLDMNFVTEKGDSLLTVALHRFNSRCEPGLLEVLLDCGLRATPDEGGSSAMWGALMHSSAELFRRVVASEPGCLEAPNVALFQAALHGRPDIMMVLIEHGGNPSHREVGQRSALEATRQNLYRYSRDAGRLTAEERARNARECASYNACIAILEGAKTPPPIHCTAIWTQYGDTPPVQLTIAAFCEEALRCARAKKTTARMTEMQSRPFGTKDRHAFTVAKAHLIRIGARAAAKYLD
jgi:hypothetical protein